MQTLFIIFSLLILPLSLHANGHEATHWREKADDLAFFLDLNNPNYKQAKHTFSTFYENVTRWVFPNYFKPHPLLGTGYIPLMTARDVIRTDQAILYNVELEFDEFSRREIPRLNTESAKRFVILGGCSFMMGQGVSADETVAYHLSQLNPKRYPLNYGIQGSSLNVLLRQLQLIKPELELPFEQGDLIYMYMSSHPERAAMTLPSYDWMSNTPYFQFNDNGKIEKFGPMQEMRPYRHWLLTSLRKWLPTQWLNNRITPAVFQSDWNYTCQLIKAIDEQWKSMKKRGAFVVYLHPLSFIPKQLYQCLDEARIAYIQGSREPLSEAEAKIPIDGHPTGALNQLVAQQIEKALLEQEGLEITLKSQ